MREHVESNGLRQGVWTLTLGFLVERVTVRVTGIEPALSAWESDE
jgi:hypothetical protein